MSKEQVLELIATTIKETLRIYNRGVTEAFVIFGLAILFLAYEIYKLRAKNEKIFRLLEDNSAQNKELLALAKADKEVSNERFNRLQTDIDYLKKNGL